MAYYQDLTPYKYLVDYEPLEPPLLNVGWLSASETFVRGESPQMFKDHLFEFCQDNYIVQLTRGFHVCEFCSGSGSDEPTNSMPIGNGEIRVIGKSAVYAAPMLIYHYVVDHQYRPPEEFIEAVLTGPLPGSDEHLALLSRYNED